VCEIWPQLENAFRSQWLDCNLTLWYLLSKYDVINLCNKPIIPYNYNLDDNILWLTQSKVFSRSRKIPPTLWPSFRAICIWSSNLCVVLSVEELALNPNCSLARILLTQSHHLTTLGRAIFFCVCIIWRPRVAVLQGYWNTIGDLNLIPT
jgi:hypothetical protein